MKISNEEKYQNILIQEREILNNIKANILKNKELVSANLEGINDSLKNMENSKNKIQRINKIQNTISSILEKIVTAETIEELTDLRSSLNNEIKKVRTVLSKMENYDQSRTEELIATTRNNISKLYRNKNRNEKLEQISILVNKKDLTNEEKKELSRQFKNENSYIRRIKITKSELECIKKRETKKATINQIKIIDNPTIVKEAIIEEKTNIDSEIFQYMDRYNVYEPIEYGKNFITNIVTFFDNIPAYKNNNDSLLRLCSEYNNYKGCKSIEMLRDYLYSRYSISGIVNSIFFKNTKHVKAMCGEHFKENIIYVNEMIKRAKAEYKEREIQYTR